jgi:exocyst complex component 3
VHRNFAQTQEIVNNLEEMYSRLNVLEAMLAQDARDPAGPNRNLLPLHYQLHQLEAFKNQAMHQAKKSSPQMKATLNEYFARLTKLIEDFDRHIATIAKNVLELVRAGYPDVVVKLLKIADMEGKADEKVCGRGLGTSSTTASGVLTRYL